MQNASGGRAPSGFTLIELSIVLVIIGLIVGGVLVGEDLIKAAGIRATVSQVEKYNAAVNTFHTKYNGIPGDLTAATANTLQFFTFTSPGAGMGDGNGLIEGGASGEVKPQGETLAFWRHLSDANLLDGSFGAGGASAIDAATGKTSSAVTDILESLPQAKAGRGDYFVVYAAEGGLNYYQMAGITGIDTTPNYTFGSSSLTPIEAYDIDVKLDDGVPNTGIVQARGISAINVPPTFHSGSQSNTCTNGSTASDTASTYNSALATGGNDPSCSIRFRFN